MRYAASVEYDGTGYRGWQRQPHARSVQEAVEDALAQVANHPVSVACAGRTDTGVHATGQVISFDSEATRPPKAWLLGGNSNLPPDVSLRWVVPVEADFHARFSARSRRYRYLILNRPTRSALLRHRVSWCHHPLDEARMARAARHLLGEHDFSAFRSGACQARHPVRTLYEISVTRSDDRIRLDVHANGFLHNMIRIIAGVLMAVGRGEADEAWPQRLLKEGDRRRSGMTAPAAGLYFCGAHYPQRFGLPSTLWWPNA